MSIDPQNSFTEVTSESWLGRIGESFKRVLFGVILFVLAFPLLWWNEGRAVRTAKGLTELSHEVVSVTADKVDPTNDGKPVHITAQATSDETLTDPVFNVATKGIKLARRVAMYQWQEQQHTETRKKLGGGTETVTTYTYDKAWSSDSKDSSRSNQGEFHVQWGHAEGAGEFKDSTKFKHPEGHQNPAQPKFPNEVKVAAKVAFGAFTLSPGLVGQLNQFEDLPLSQEDLAKLPEDVRTQVKPDGGRLYAGNDPGSPQVGDLRIQFRVVKPAVVSILAKQSGETFAPWRSHSDTDVERLIPGTVDAQGMVQVMERENTMLTWLLRLGGFVVMALGVGLVLTPLVVVADVVPFLGNLLGMGVAITAGVIAAVFSLLTIALAWMVYRPLVGIGLLLAALAIVFLAKKLSSGRKPVPIQ
ncbi:MAG: TMEM43 family protein [Isosphaeraceae bacterium]